MKYQVKWIIKQTKFFPRMQGTVFVMADCAESAKREARFVLARALVVHAAMIVPYRVMAAASNTRAGASLLVPTKQSMLEQVVA